jgi:hypothetical protein
MPSSRSTRAQMARTNVLRPSCAHVSQKEGIN